MDKTKEYAIAYKNDVSRKLDLGVMLAEEYRNIRPESFTAFGPFCVLDGIEL